MYLHNKPGVTDAHLQERFVEHRDEAAFAALVHRHGSMAYGVARKTNKSKK